MCGNDFHECAGEKIEHVRKCDILIECKDCLYGRVKELDSCCITPNIIFINQPNVNGNPSKKPYCTNCGYTTKPVKFENSTEYLKIPLITKQYSDSQFDERHETRSKFYAWLKNRRENETTTLDEMHNKDYRDYLNTPKWKAIRLKVLKRDNNLL